MSKANKKILNTETDGQFLLKIVLYVILASVWLRFSEPVVLLMFEVSSVPIGLVLGLFIARHEKFQIDKKIEYVVLIVMTILTYFLPAGIVI